MKCYDEEKDWDKEGNGIMVKVDVDVTKIVKYVCITGFLIVACIFGEKCFRDFLENPWNAE